MKKRMLTICIAAGLLLTMAACGTEEAESASSAISAVEESSVQSDSADTEASAEDSAQEAASAEAEEEVELTVDEKFDAIAADAEGICLKLQCYDNRGTPIRNGTVTVSAEDQENTYETDYSGYALIDNLQPDVAYTIAVTTGDQEDDSLKIYGSVVLTATAGDRYAAVEDNEGDKIEFFVGDGAQSLVDLAMTATTADGTGGFEVSRLSEWAGIPEG